MHIAKENDDNEIKRKHQNSISFTLITIRVYEQIIESHPCVRRGPGLGIGWNSKVSEICHIDDYERRIKEEGKDRQSKCTRLGPKERETILYKLGYTSEDIHNCVCEIHDKKDDRLETAFEDSFEEDDEEISSDDNEDAIGITSSKSMTATKGFRFLPRSYSDPSLQSGRRSIKSLAPTAFSNNGRRRNSETNCESSSSINETPKKRTSDINRFGFLSRVQSDPLLQRRRASISDVMRSRGSTSTKEKFNISKTSSFFPFIDKKLSMKIPKYMRSSSGKNNNQRSSLTLLHQ